MVRGESSAPENAGIEDAEAKAAADPENLNAQRALADHYLRSGRHTDAVDVLQRCLELAGGADPQLERRLSTAKEHQLAARLAEAEDADNREQTASLRKELEAMRLDNAARQVGLYPNDLQLKFEYAKLLFENNRLTEAVRQFQQAERNPQRRVRCRLYLAQCFKAKGQTVIAREKLQEALADLPAMDSTKKEALYELGLLLEETGEKEEALRCFTEIYAVDISYRDVAAKVETK